MRAAAIAAVPARAYARPCPPAAFEVWGWVDVAASAAAVAVEVVAVEVCVAAVCGAAVVAVALLISVALAAALPKGVDTRRTKV
jgi:hypothetical protein